MKKDIAQVAPAKVKEMVTLEVGDTEKYEAYYNQTFAGFIEASGFDVRPKFEDSPLSSNIVLINGHACKIDTKNCAVTYRSPYTKRAVQRKPENRFIVLSAGYRVNILKVVVNKEVDAARLRNKLNSHIAAIEQRSAARKAQEKLDEENTVFIGMHYMSNDFISTFVTSLKIDKGTILFVLRNGYVLVKTDGTLKVAGISPINFNTIQDVMNFELMDEMIPATFSKIVLEILNQNPLQSNLIEWASTAYNKHFYTKTMSTTWKEA